ncbi:MAG: DUF1517 domain-containing protein, partial [Pseudanabaena sp. LacPavin_0818_WC45_MAG_42_6]|nr:DUF1517 domain-containing protein [Pseudanabaena sp. LacPavin_0818_WC45_MAG_42_6]
MVQVIELGFNDHKFDTYFLKDQQAYAKSSAGRSKGGSFTRSSPSSSSNSKSSTPSKSSPSNTSSPSSDRDSLTTPSQPSSNRPSTIVAPVIINNPSNNSPYDPYRATTSTSSNGISWFVWIIILLIIFAIVYFIIRAIMMRSKQIETGHDLGNETFTVSKLQVALFAQAREVQSRLTELTLEVDTDTPEGLMTLMQESALAL